MNPAISIVISSFGTRAATWDRVRDCLQAIAAQDISGVEVVLCKMPELPGEVPSDLQDIVPTLRVMGGSSPDAHARKTLGVRAAAAPIVALIDADCMPRRGWVQTVLETFAFYPEVAMVQGRMSGENGGFAGSVRRFFAGPEPKVAGPAKYTATNNVAFRREAYLEYPLPEGSGSDAVRIQTAAMLRAHYVLWQEPAMVALRDRRGLATAAGVAAEHSTAIAR